MQNSSIRRQFLKQGAAIATGALLCGSDVEVVRGASEAASQPQKPLAFFAIGDTHFFANDQATGELKLNSMEVCQGLVNTLNQLPGSAIPEEAGGGTVGAIQGVLHAGDIVDSGDKRGANFEAMQRTEWNAFVREFGLTGSEGRLKFPVFEVHGNHDSPSGSGVIIDGLIERNRQRSRNGMLTSISNNGLHCSWDWGGVHFVNLGIVVGADRKVAQRRRYNPMESLDFLIGDLQQHVGGTGRPVWLTHHIDVLRYSKPCDPTDEKNLSLEWNPCDVAAYYSALQGYNVLALLYGHTHVRNVQRWNGTAEKVEQGFPLLNVDNSSHFSGGSQAFFYVEVAEGEMHVRECSTKDSWGTHSWTPMIWKFPLRT